MRPWWSRLLWRPRPTSSSTRSPSRSRDRSVVSPRPVARLLLDETDRIALRVGDRGDGRSVADGPVEQLAVEGGLAFGVNRHDLPVDHRTRPVAHRAHPRTTRSGA